MQLLLISVFVIRYLSNLHATCFCSFTTTFSGAKFINYATGDYSVSTCHLTGCLLKSELLNLNMHFMTQNVKSIQMFLLYNFIVHQNITQSA
jgi:hypothetical protein